MTDQLGYRNRPCGECPFRTDMPPGQFPARQYEALRGTVGTAEQPLLPGAPLFACHMTVEGKEVACAGWLAVCGRHHLTVRIAVIKGELPATALEPSSAWPALFASYDEMAAAQGGRR